MIKKILKIFLRLQHTYLPIPLIIYKYLFKFEKSHKFFYSYYRLCFDTDFNHKKPNTSEFNQSYWLSKRSLYWHYTHLHHNRFTSLYNEILKKYYHLFENKKVCDLMAGISPFFKSNKNFDLMFIEGNSHCCKILKKSFPNSNVIKGSWDLIEKYQDEVETLFISSGCLIYLSSEEVEKFFKITNKIKNFVFIHEGTDLEDFVQEYSGHTQWNLEKRLKKYNIHYSKSKIFYKKQDSSAKVFEYFVYSS